MCFFKQKTAYEVRISDWSSDVCSSDLPRAFVPIEYLIELFGDLLFPGFAIRSLGVFRIIRDSDIELEEEAEDLVRLFRTAIRRRRRGRVILMELEADMPAEIAGEIGRAHV